MIDGKNVTGTSGYVGYMLQKDLLLPYKTVYDNIALPLMLSHKTKQEIAAQIQPNLTIFGLDGLTKNIPISYLVVSVNESHYFAPIYPIVN